MNRRIVAPIAGAFALVVVGCGTNLNLNRGMEIDEFEAHSPESYADRWGDPDEWTDEKVGGELQTTMKWNCVEGEAHIMVWRLRQHDSGRNFWTLVSEETREGHCPE